MKVYQITNYFGVTLHGEEIQITNEQAKHRDRFLKPLGKNKYMVKAPCIFAKGEIVAIKGKITPTQSTQMKLKADLVQV